MKIQRAAYPFHWLKGISKEHHFIVDTLYSFNHKKISFLYIVSLFTYYLLRPLTSLLTDWLHSFGSLSLKASLTFKASPLHIKCLPALHGACGVRLPSLLLHPLSHPLSHSLIHLSLSLHLIFDMNKMHHLSRSSQTWFT